jgi:hypothetical protein
MDVFLEGEYTEPEIYTTPYIDFQLDKYNDKEYFTQKNIPLEALFAPTLFINKLTKFYKTNLDIPLLIYGFKGCGKLSAILGLINSNLYTTVIDNSDNASPNNVPLLANNVSPNNVPLLANNVSPNNVPLLANNVSHCNNIYYMKILDKEYDKILVYENIFYLNIDILSTTEIALYLKHIYKISRSNSIDGNKKIVIISHIEKCNNESQKYIHYILDKQNGNTSYIFTTIKINNINKKILSSCARLYFGYLNITEFSNIFLFNYKTKSGFEQKHFLKEYLKEYYKIYINNQYNIGTTISQIKYIIDTKDITLEKLKTDEFRQSLMYNITKNFIKKKLKLSSVNNALDIRKFLYTLLSLNIDLLEFCKYLIKQLLESKINNSTKALIITKSGELSYELTHINKEIISFERFIYDIIYIVYKG